MLVRYSSMLHTLPTTLRKLGKSVSLPQHLPAALTTSELLFKNAKHVFNIYGVTPRGNLYKHLFIQDMENKIRWKRSHQRVLWFALSLSQCSEAQVLRPTSAWDCVFVWLQEECVEIIIITINLN